MTPDDLKDFEQEVAAAFNQGRIRAPVHLHGGNEEQLIEIFQDVADEDWVFSTWRSHYHCLLKGVPREQLMKDILAGKSITLNYPEYGVLTSAIVAGILPIALGVALGIQLRGSKQRVHCFVGDMTQRTGTYHEVAQYAFGHGLPMRLIVEDNGKSVCTPTFETWGIKHTWGLPSVKHYSYDLPWPHSGAGVRVQF